MKNNYYGNVGKSNLETNNTNRANNGYTNKYDDAFYNNGPHYNEARLAEIEEKKQKAARDNMVGSIILFIIIIALLIIFVIPNLDFSFLK